MVSSIKRFLREEDGVTALEYALLAAAIATAILASSTQIQNFFKGIFTTLTSIVSAQAPTSGTPNPQ